MLKQRYEKIIRASYQKLEKKNERIWNKGYYIL
jgi:hypothetical protein